MHEKGKVWTHSIRGPTYWQGYKYKGPDKQKKKGDSNIEAIDKGIEVGHRHTNICKIIEWSQQYPNLLSKRRSLVNITELQRGYKVAFIVLSIHWYIGPWYSMIKSTGLFFLIYLLKLLGNISLYILVRCYCDLL